MIIIVLFLLHLIFLINTQFTLWPEMVVYPYLVNNGFLLYRDIINPYPPILSWFLAIFAKMLGYSPLSYQILTWILILIIDFSIFLITKKLFKKSFYALVSTAFFVIFSIPFGVNGIWFDLVQTPFILWTLYFFYEFLNSKTGSAIKVNLFVSFLLLTIAFFIKQQVFWIALLFLVLALLKYKFSLSKFLKNHYPAFLPFCALLLFHIFFFVIQGIEKDFAFWVFNFPLIASKIPGYVLTPSVRQALTVFALFVILIPVFSKKPERFFLIAALVLVLFAYPRFDYFHLIPLLAVISLLFGVNIYSLANSKVSTKGIFLVAVIFLGLFTLRYFQKYWHEESRFFEQNVLKNARVINLLVGEDKKIYLQNAPDQLLVLSNTVPPKPWVDDFPWYLEVQNLQDKLIGSLDQDKPRYIIFQPYLEEKKYELGSYRPGDIADYIDNNYVNLDKIDNGLYIKIRK